MSRFVYDIILETQIGAKRGNLSLDIDRGTVEGQLTVLEKEEPCRGRVDEQGNCRLQGRLVTLTQVIDYSATGSIGEQGVHLTLLGGGRKYFLYGACTSSDG